MAASTQSPPYASYSPLASFPFDDSLPLDDYLLYAPNFTPQQSLNGIMVTGVAPAGHAEIFSVPMMGVQYAQANVASAHQATGLSPSFARASALSVMGGAAASELGSPVTSGGRSTLRPYDSNPSTGHSMVWRAGPGAESVVGSSVSPVEKILTPSSTYDNVSMRDDSHDDMTGDDDNDPILYPQDLSPTSTSNTADSSFELVSRNLSSTGSFSGAVSMNNHAPQSSNDSGASRASSAAPQPSSTLTNFSGRWGSVATTVGWMDSQGGDPSNLNSFGNLTSGYATFAGNTYPSAGEFDSALLSDAGPFDNVAATDFTSHLPFRATEDYASSQQSYRMGQHYSQAYPQQQVYQQQHQSRFQPFNAQQHQYQLHTQYLTPQDQARFRQAPEGMYPARLNTTLPQQQQQPQQYGLRHAPPLIKQQGLESLVTGQSHQSSRRPSPREDSSRSVETQSRPRMSAARSMHHAEARGHPSHLSTASSSTPQPQSKPVPIIKAEPSVAPNDTLRQVSQGGRRGGRQPHSHLPESARQKSHKMRKITACWRCALQRDPCDEGMPCGRCLMRTQKGQAYFFDCDRSKLPDFVTDFLPPTMTLMHQKQTIEDTVNAEVVSFDSHNPIDVYLTSGYGPALRWKLFEFRPKTPELLGQLQYFQDPHTGISQGHHKYSPPFGLMKLDQNDDTHFDAYLEILMEEQYLQDLGWTCFEEETQVDPESPFQANLLDYMCKLYKDTDDIDLKALLKAIIRMMIITYIMGHTLTIVEETLASVLTNIRYSQRPQEQMRQISPRLANRQLKFFFALLRMNTYNDMLRWQQQTLHTSGKKESSWLTSFCAMLGFAMVLEEVQRTLQIQADAKVAKKEMTEEHANAEAKNACERIDARYKLLVGLFQCKYRDKKWGEQGSFGAGTPQFKGMAEKRFLSTLRMLVEEKREHLEARQHIQCAPENQCRYTSRLVARFLLPFLKLPG